MPTLGPDEVKVRARLSAHARRLFIQGGYSSLQGYADKLRLDYATVHRVVTGERDASLGFLVAMHQELRADANELLTQDPEPRWFKPLELRRTFEWK